MNASLNSIKYRLLRPIPAFVITIVLMVLIVTLDYAIGPTADLSILYFLPITFAAWTLGRHVAIACAFVAEIPHFADQFALVARGYQSTLVADIDVILRLLVFLFVAEVTYRLVASRTETSRGARRLQVLNDDLRRSYERLDEDMDAAGSLQASYLLPDPVSVPGCDVGASVKYAGKIGGDFADAGVVNGRVYACVADISGKGTPAALFSALLKHLINDSIRRGFRGAGVVNRVHAALCSALPPEKFVTLFYVEVDPASGAVEYVNAGHPEGLIYRASSAEIDVVPPNAPLLGFRELPVAATTSSLRMADGDVLVLYSDGATESKTPDGNRLGDEPIRRFISRYADLSAKDMAKAISEEIQAATDPSRRDDLAVVCVRITNPTT